MRDLQSIYLSNYMTPEEFKRCVNREFKTALWIIKELEHSLETSLPIAERDRYAQWEQLANGVSILHDMITTFSNNRYAQKMLETDD